MRMVSPKGGCCLGVNCWVEIDSSANCAAIPINAYVGADILSSGDSQDVKNILALQNAFEKTRKQMKVNALSINALSNNLNFQMFAKLTLKKT